MFSSFSIHLRIIEYDWPWHVCILFFPHISYSLRFNIFLQNSLCLPFSMASSTLTHLYFFLYTHIIVTSNVVLNCIYLVLLFPSWGFTMSATSQRWLVDIFGPTGVWTGSQTVLKIRILSWVSTFEIWLRTHKNLDFLSHLSQATHVATPDIYFWRQKLVGSEAWVTRGGQQGL